LLSRHRPLYALGLIQNGSPKHPLYVRAEQAPEPLGSYRTAVFADIMPAK
jgi:hypothetical protein